MSIPLPGGEPPLARAVPGVVEPATRQRPPAEVGDGQRDDPDGDPSDQGPHHADRAEQPESEGDRAEHQRPRPAHRSRTARRTGCRRGRDHEQLEHGPAEALDDVDPGGEIRAALAERPRASAPSPGHAPARRSHPRPRASGSRRGIRREWRRARRGARARGRGSRPRPRRAVIPRGCPIGARGRARRGRGAGRAQARCPTRCRGPSRPASVPLRPVPPGDASTACGRPACNRLLLLPPLRRRRTCRGRGRGPMRRRRARPAGRRRRTAYASRRRPLRGARTRASSSAPTRRCRSRPARSRCRATSRSAAHRGRSARRPVLSRGEQRDRAASGLAQQLVERRLPEIDKPTSGGSRESPTSEPTVSPRRWPLASTVTTAYPAGKRPSGSPEVIGVGHQQIV